MLIHRFVCHVLLIALFYNIIVKTPNLPYEPYRTGLVCDILTFYILLQNIVGAHDLPAKGDLDEVDIEGG